MRSPSAGPVKSPRDSHHRRSAGVARTRSPEEANRSIRIYSRLERCQLALAFTTRRTARAGAAEAHAG